MTRKMHSYLRALGSHKNNSVVLSESIEQFRNIEVLFESKIEKMRLATSRRDAERLIEAINEMESAIQTARELLEKVQINEANYRTN